MSELHVRKVRETETGGQPTPIEDPYRLSMNLSHTGFASWVGRVGLFKPIDIEISKPIPMNLSFST